MTNLTDTLRPKPYVLEWPQWSDYAIDDTIAEPVIFPTGTPKAPRRITSADDVVNAFATMATKADGQAAMLTFVREFGLLGHSVLAGGDVSVPGAPPIVLPRRAPRARQRRSAPSVAAVRRMADPVLWVHRHAQNVQRVLQLHGSRDRDLDRLLAAFDARRVRVAGRATKAEPPLSDDSVSWGPRVRISARPAVTVPLLGPPWMRVLRDLDEDDRPRTGPDQLARSRRIIGALLDPNLGGVTRVYDTTSGEVPFRFRALIQVIYWQLADRLIGGEGLRQCRCGGWWFPTDSRQQDHPECFQKFYMQEYRAGIRRRRQKNPRSKQQPKVKRSTGGRR